MAGLFEFNDFVPQFPPSIPAISSGPGVYVRMQGVMQSTIEFAGVSALEHHGEIPTVGPIGFRSELRLHLLEELGPRKGIRNGNADVVWPRIAHEVHRPCDLLPCLAGIPKLQKVTGADPLFMEIRA